VSTNSAVELKGSMYTFLSLKLQSSDPTKIGEAIADKVMQAPGFFSNTPVVVDLTAIEDEESVQLGTIIATIREHKLVPVVASLRDRGHSMASDLDIPVVEAGNRPQSSDKDSNEQESSATDSNEDSEQTSDDPADETSEALKPAEKLVEKNRELDPIDLAMAGSEIEYITKQPKLLARPVRSGQQVYAKDTDLVIVGQVGPGAEVLADNNIHIYGPLRGRALCGVTGNRDARIFCQSLEAELVSIAGIYKLLEDVPDELRGKPAQVRVADETIIIEGL